MKNLALGLLLAALLAVPASATVPTDVSDQPGSLTRSSGEPLDTRRWQEIRESPAQFRLVVNASRSSILWQSGDRTYVYSLSGAGHVSQAASLLDLLRESSLVSFVASRDPVRKDGFTGFHEVRALQIGVSKSDD